MGFDMGFKIAPEVAAQARRKADRLRELGVIKQPLSELEDAGSPEFVIDTLTRRINSLAEHFKMNKKDNHSRRGLLKMVSQRRSLLDYVKGKDPKRYQAIIEKHGIRR